MLYFFFFFFFCGLFVKYRLPSLLSARWFDNVISYSSWVEDYFPLHIHAVEITVEIGTFADTNVERKRCMYDVTLTSLSGACLISAFEPRQIDVIRTAFTFYVRVTMKGPTRKKMH